MSSYQRFPVISSLFFCSGAAGLVYEVVWSRQLQLLFGSTAFSVSAVLTAFFSGMALGSYSLGRWGNRGHPLRIYALLEFGLGVYVLLMPLFTWFTDWMYLQAAPSLSQHFLPAQGVKLLLALVLILVPCTLMGGTLPVLSRAVSCDSGNHNRAVGLLYAINTLGAVSGAAISGFYLIERFGLSRLLVTGAVLNIMLGLVSWFLSYRVPDKRTSKGTVLRKDAAAGIRLPLTVYTVSGFCALAYEVLWTRSLVQTFASSTYAFTSVLLIFLLGTSLGTGFMRRLVAKIRNPVFWFAAVQTGIALSALLIMILIPRIPLLYHTMSGGSMHAAWHSRAAAMIAISALLLLLPSFLLGSLFPLVLEWIKNTAETGYTVGRMYSANTVGAILGSLAAGYVLIPLAGVHGSMLFLILVNAVLGLGLFWTRGKEMKKRLLGTGSVLILLLFLIFAFLPDRLFLFSRVPNFKLLFYREDAVANVAVLECTAPGRNFRVLKVNNVYQSGGTDSHALMVQRRQGHLPMLLHDDPKHVLVIGLATGITLSAVTEHGAEYIDCIEIVPSQIEAVRYFSRENSNVIRDPRVHIIIDDGRSFIRTSKRKYDVIIGDLFQVNSSGTGNLYALEHAKACRDLLDQNGLLVQWFPLQQFLQEDFRSALRSFTEAFPHVQLWFCDTSPEKPVIGIAASLNPVPLNLDAFRRRITSGRAVSLSSTGYDNPYFFTSQCIMQDRTLRAYVKGAILNTYDCPHIEFSSPRTAGRKTGILIIRSLMRHGSPLHLEAESGEDLEMVKHYVTAHFQNLVAQLAGTAGRWEEAESILDGIIRQVPDNPDTRRLLGRAKVVLASDLIQRGMYGKAVQKLDSAELLGIRDVYVDQLRERIIEKSNDE